MENKTTKMQSKSDEQDELVTNNHSDSDDWTMVSPPDSSASSSSILQQENNQPHQTTLPSARGKEQPSNNKKQRRDHAKQSNRALRDAREDDERKQLDDEKQELRASGSQDADDEEDDGLVEIDLNVDEDPRSAKLVSHERTVLSRQKKATKNADSVPISNVQSQTTMVKVRDSSTNTQANLNNKSVNTKSNKQLCQVRESRQELGESVISQILRLLEAPFRKETESISKFCACLVLILSPMIMIAVMRLKSLDKDAQNSWDFEQRTEKLQRIINTSLPLDLFYIHPSDTAHVELLLLDQDLSACVVDGGYGWVDKDGKWTEKPSENNGRIFTQKKSSTKRANSKPFRGMVCYEREREWRRRFKKLKDEFNIDLRKIVRQAHKSFTGNLLESMYPGLKYKLIINQLEYLDHLDEHRRGQELERLKAENLELKKRLSREKAPFHKTETHANEHGTAEATKATSLDENYVHHQSKSLDRLENENTQLRRENDVLKASLVEKAGTVYIKQSLELEKCERENSLMKKFHQQIAYEISKRLKELDLNTIDASALLNDHESLSSQLALTRGYLLRLGEEISKLAANKKKIQKELQFYKALLDTLTSTHQIKQIEQTDEAYGEKIADTKSYPQFGFEDLNTIKGDFTMEDTTSSENNKSISKGDNSKESCLSSKSSSSNDADTPTTETIFVPYEEEAPASLTSSRGNWLMRRAKLRERLRKSSGIDIVEKHIDRLLDQSKHFYKKSLDRKHQHNHDKSSNNYHPKEHWHKHHTNRNNANSNKKYSGPPKDDYNKRKHRIQELVLGDRSDPLLFIENELNAGFAAFRDEL